MQKLILVSVDLSPFFLPRSYGNPACADCKGKTCAGHYMMPDELFCCDDSTRVASSPPSEVLKTLYDKDAKDLEGAAKQVLLPTNEVRHIRIVLTRI